MENCLPPWPVSTFISLVSISDVFFACMGWDQILVPVNPSEFRVVRMDPGMGRLRHQKAIQ